MLPPLDFFKGMSRDSARERQLARDLRTLPEADRFRYIEQILPINQTWGLTLAHATLQKPKYFEAILDLALDQADASSIRGWLHCVITRIGFPRTVAHLQNRASSHPDPVAHARYWLTDHRDRPDYSRDLVAAPPEV